MASAKLAYRSLIATCLWSAVTPTLAQTNTEQRFQDLFVTAGYSTAFGAALGAAFLGLGLNPQPSSGARWVAMGASMGFIGGSILGTYVAFSPVLVQPGTGSANFSFVQPTSTKGLRIGPLVDTTKQSILGLAASTSIGTFP